MEIDERNRYLLQPYVDKFIDVANELSAQGTPHPVISSAFLTACAHYATFVTAGNEGALKESGVSKLTEIFSKELSALQRLRVEAAQKRGSEISNDL